MTRRVTRGELQRGNVEALHEHPASIVNAETEDPTSLSISLFRFVTPQPSTEAPIVVAVEKLCVAFVFEP